MLFFSLWLILLFQKTWFRLVPTCLKANLRQESLFTTTNERRKVEVQHIVQRKEQKYLEGGWGWVWGGVGVGEGVDVGESVSGVVEEKGSTLTYTHTHPPFTYIGDLFIASNASLELLRDLVRFWNRLDENIGFSETIGVAAQYLDVHLKNEGGRLTTRVYQKPSYEPYFLPYTSARAAHIKKNIPYGALVRAIRYSTSYADFKQEETHICMALLLNAYPLWVHSGTVPEGDEILWYGSTEAE